MTTVEIRKRVKEYMEIGFTMSEAFKCMKDAKRQRGRKTSKVAEARARVAEATGIETKSYSEIKFGEQSNIG